MPWQAELLLNTIGPHIDTRSQTPTVMTTRHKLMAALRFYDSNGFYCFVGDAQDQFDIYNFRFFLYEIRTFIMRVLEEFFYRKNAFIFPHRNSILRFLGHEKNAVATAIKSDTTAICQHVFSRRVQRLTRVVIQQKNEISKITIIYYGRKNKQPTSSYTRNHQ